MIMRQVAYRPVFVLAFALLAVGLLAGCGDDDPVGPTVEAVAGSYAATTFTATSSAGTVDVLQQGGILQLTLAPDGTASGRVLIPQAGGGGSDFDESLAGTWTVQDGIVRLSQPADTFLRDLPLRVDGGRLHGEATFNGTTVVVVLERT